MDIKKNTLSKSSLSRSIKYKTLNNNKNNIKLIKKKNSDTE